MGYRIGTLTDSSGVSHIHLSSVRAPRANGVGCPAIRDMIRWCTRVTVTSQHTESCPPITSPHTPVGPRIGKDSEGPQILQKLTSLSFTHTLRITPPWCNGVDRGYTHNCSIPTSREERSRRCRHQANGPNALHGSGLPSTGEPSISSRRLLNKSMEGTPTIFRLPSTMKVGTAVTPWASPSLRTSARRAA